MKESEFNGNNLLLRSPIIFVQVWSVSGFNNSINFEMLNQGFAASAKRNIYWKERPKCPVSRNQKESSSL